MACITLRSGRGTITSLVSAGVFICLLFARRLPEAGRIALYESLVVLGGVALMVFGFVALRKKRLIENIPTSRIRSVAMGFGELTGAARPDGPTLSAPLSGMPCVYYRYLIEEKKSRPGRGHGSWRTLERGESSEPFLLDDGTGTIRVDPKGADAILRIAWRDYAREGGWFSRSRRHTEWRVIPSQRTYVLGTVRALRDREGERRAEYKERLRDLKGDAVAMQCFDADGDGRIGAEEWGTAVRSVQDDMLRRQLAEAGEAPPPGEELVIGKGGHETTFVIGDRSEASLTRNLAMQSSVALLCGVALVVLGGIGLLDRSNTLPLFLNLIGD